MEFDPFFVPRAMAVAMLVATGLVVGSYLNVVVYRLPAGISTVYPGSRCPRCLMPVQPWDNVPVLSYLWLGARCRSCRTTISIRYPLVELLTAFLFLASYWRFSDRPVAIAASCGYSALLVALGLIDWDHRRIPGAWAPIGILLGFGVRSDLGRAELGDAAFAAVAGGIGILVLSKAWKLWAGTEGFGAGDAWFLAMVGVFSGTRGVAAVFVAASTGALIWVGARRLTGRARPFESIPFVTFLSAAALVAHFLEP